MREFIVTETCALSVAQFHALRSATDFERWFAKRDNRECHFQSQKKTTDKVATVLSTPRTPQTALVSVGLCLVIQLSAVPALALTTVYLLLLCN